MLKAICLDLDETLLDDNTSYLLSISHTCEELKELYGGIELVVASYQRISEAYWLEVGDAVMSGKLDGEAVRLEGWSRTLAHHGYSDPSMARAALDAYSRHRSATYTLFPDAVQFLAQVPSVIKLAVVTNGSTFTQREKVQRTGLSSRVDAVIVSGEAGIAKPDAAIFSLALKLLDVSPHEAIHVGDSLTSDVQGARNANLLAAVWLNRGGVSRTVTDPEPTCEISTLTQLIALLWNHA